MTTSSLEAALDRTERALLRIERSASQRPAAGHRDDALRAKVAGIVAELDEIIRDAGANR